MSKKIEREKFAVKNEPDIRTFKKAFFVIGYIALLIIAFSIITTLFISFSHGNPIPYGNTINYTYSDVTAYEYNDTVNPEFNTGTNVINQTIYTNTYNATYSFTNDANGANPADFSITEGTGTDCQIVSDYNNHDKVMRLQDNGAGALRVIKDEGVGKSYGFIEFWYLASGTSSTMDFKIASNPDATISDAYCIMRINFYTGLKARIYYSGSYYEVSYSQEIWYHWKITWDSTSSNYDNNGLDQFSVYQNGKKLGTWNFWYNFASVDTFAVTTWGSASASYTYWDAIGNIWDTSYSIGDNIIPYNYQTSTLQTKLWSFTYDINGNVNEGGSDNYYDWDYTDISDDLHIAALPNDNFVVMFNSISTDEIILERDFSITDNIYTVNFSLNIYNFGDPDTNFYIKLYSSDSTEISRLLITGNTDNTGTLKYYDGSTYQTLASIWCDISTYPISNYNYTFSLSKSDNIFKLLYNDSVYSYPSLDITKTGLGTVAFTSARTVGAISYNQIIYLDNISVQDMDTSYSTDFKTYNINIINDFDTSISNNVYIRANGYLALSLVGSTYYEQNITLLSFNNYDSSTLYYFDIKNLNEYHNFSQFTTPTITIATNNTEFLLSYIYITGFGLSDNFGNSYAAIISSNIDYGNVSYFYINDNNLYYTFTANNSNLEYMNLTFILYLIDVNIETTNRSFSISGYSSNVLLPSNAYLEYTYGSNTPFSFSTSYKSYNTRLTDNRIIYSISFNLTDNNISYNGTTTGYYTPFSLGFIPSDVHDLPVLPFLSNSLSLIQMAVIIFPIPILSFISLRKRFKEHELLAYLMTGIIGDLISTVVFFSMDIMPLFIYVTLFVAFSLLVLPNMINRYMLLGLMGVSFMVYGGFFATWFYVIMLFITSFTTILAIRNMNNNVGG